MKIDQDGENNVGNFLSEEANGTSIVKFSLLNRGLTPLNNYEIVLGVKPNTDIGKKTDYFFTRIQIETFVEEYALNYAGEPGSTRSKVGGVFNTEEVIGPDNNRTEVFLEDLHLIGKGGNHSFSISREKLRPIEGRGFLKVTLILGEYLSAAGCELVISLRSDEGYADHIYSRIGELNQILETL
jgi:hypothetical protein